MSESRTVRLDAKVALVTGGGGGIGRAVSLTLAAHGAAVVLVERDEVRARDTAAAIDAAGGRSCAVVADVESVEDVHAAVDAALAAFGRIDVLVNNVGDFLGLSKPFVESSEQEWEALYSINLRQIFRVTRAVLPHMIAQGEGGSVINLSTIEAFRGIPGCVVYGALKSAISGFTKSLAVELGPEGIRVNAIAPETTETLQVQPSSWIPPDKQENIPYWTPLGRFGTPEDAADCALFLASDLSRWMTGTTLHLDGGALAAGGFYRVPGGGWTNMPVVKGAGIGG